MDHAELLFRLLPPECYSPDDPALSAQLFAEGQTLDTALANADRLLAAVTPYGAGETISDWERVVGVTPVAGAPLQDRIDAVVAKLARIGGLSIPHFIQLAASLGYTISIVEPQPFRVDVSRVGDTIYIDDVIFVWQVVVAGAPAVSYYFRVDASAVGEPLLWFSDPVLETVLTELKPAWTYVYFSYQG